MKKTIFTITLLISIFSVSLISCNKDDDDPQDTIIESGTYQLVFEGITATEVVGNISVCEDGYFLIAGKTPNGKSLAINMSKIATGQTLLFCTEDEIENCIENGGCSLSITALQNNYYSISGTATRTSEKTLTASGNLRKPASIEEIPFTLEVTAGILNPTNCE